MTLGVTMSQTNLRITDRGVRNEQGETSPVRSMRRESFDTSKIGELSAMKKKGGKKGKKGSC